MTPEAAPTETAPSGLPERRLHPMTLMQRFLVSLPGLIVLLLPLLRSPDANVWMSVIYLALYLVLALPYIVLSYLRFRYEINEEELVIHSGVWTRQHRNIPIEKIQNVQIEQSLLPRLFRTAKVKVETAGSGTTEGVLEYISLDEAHRVREVVRAFQRHRQAAPTPRETPRKASRDEAPVAAEPHLPASPAEIEPAPEAVTLHAMPLQRVLLSGVFRFSLLYIALFFSALQYLEPDPEALFDWFTRGQLRPVADAAAASPWLAGTLAVLLAALLAWLTGIAVNLNKYYGFQLHREGDKLHRRHGLMTLSEGTIPLRRIQTLILRTNPLMRRYRFFALRLQTMGLDAQQEGHQVAVPFARLEELLDLAPHIYPFTLPETFRRVSRLTIRRAVVRYTALLALAAGGIGYFWTPALWGFVLWPLTLLFALLRYRHHGYAVQDDALFVRRGVFGHHIWVIPLAKMQVFTTRATFFQRRLGLKTLYVDTAGAAGMAAPDVFDLPASEADALLDQLYAAFQDRVRRTAS